MAKNPLERMAARMGLDRPVQVNEAKSNDYDCKYGHHECSHRAGGPCADERRAAEILEACPICGGEIQATREQYLSGVRIDRSGRVAEVVVGAGSSAHERIEMAVQRALAE